MSSSVPNDLPSLPSTETLNQLNNILHSPFFASSRRCQEFLRYIVQETVEGRADFIKERVIAQAVFGRGARFEPGEDSLVRVKAREVRKRLTEYYVSYPESPIKIELPLGGYVPRIRESARPAPVIQVRVEPASEIAQTSMSRRRMLWIAAGSLGALGSVALVSPLLHPASPLELLWRPIFATKTPLLIFIPVLMDSGELTDRVGIGTAAAVSPRSLFLDQAGLPLQFAFRRGHDVLSAARAAEPSSRGVFLGLDPPDDT